MIEKFCNEEKKEDEGLRKTPLENDVDVGVLRFGSVNLNHFLSNGEKYKDT